MNKLALIKGVTEVLVSVGVGSITGGAIKLVTPTNVNKFVRVCTGLGSFVLTSMVIDKAAAYTNNTIQGIADAVVDVKEATEEGKEELES